MAGATLPSKAFWVFLAAVVVAVGKGIPDSWQLYSAQV